MIFNSSLTLLRGQVAQPLSSQMAYTASSSKSAVEKSFDFGIFEDESFFADDNDNDDGDGDHSSPLVDLESIVHSIHPHPMQSSQQMFVGILPDQQMSPKKSAAIAPPPLDLSKLSQKSRDRANSKHKVASEQTKSHAQSRKKKPKKGEKKKKKGKRMVVGDQEESLLLGESLQNIDNDPYQSIPGSETFYGGNNIGSFDLEYLSRNVEMSGSRESKGGNEIGFGVIEGTANRDTYKEEKESDVPTHFDLEYFTRMHDDTFLLSSGNSVHPKTDAALSSSAESTDFIYLGSSSNSGKEREKGQRKREKWTDAIIAPDSDLSLGSHSIGAFLPRHRAAKVPALL